MGAILKSQVTAGTGYLAVNLCVEGKPVKHNVHRLVAEAFLGPCPRGYECHHKDGNRANPLLGNLEWVTPEVNQQESWGAGRKHPGAKLTREDVLQIKVRLEGEGHGAGRVLAQEYGVDPSTISAIKNGRRWRRVTPEPLTCEGYVDRSCL